jgi:hypothetical protein
MVFIIDLSYMQSIKQLADDSLSIGCMTCLLSSLYVRIEALRDDPCLWVEHALSSEPEDRQLSLAYQSDILLVYY